MNSKKIYLVSPLIGIFCGLISSFPYELNFRPSIILWALSGVIIGLFVRTRREIVISGILYGLFLSVTFLYSRFGGTMENFIGYSILVLVLSVAGIFAGMLTVFLGFRIKNIF